MLINCGFYQDGNKVSDIQPKEISSYLKRPGCFVWAALANPQPAELAELQSLFGMRGIEVSDALNGHRRPKVEEYGDCLFVCMHTVDLAEGDELQTGEVNVFVGPDFVLSVRSGSSHGFADVRARCEREPHLLKHGPGFVLYALMDAIVDRYFPALDMLEEGMERLEDQIVEGRIARSSIASPYALKQKLMVLKRAAGPMLDVIGRLYGGRVPPVCAGTQEYYRDVYDHLNRINHAIENSRDMISTVIAVSLSLISLQENETTKRLAAYGALLAIPTMIAGIYGMNFEHMPELKWAFGYPVSVGLMALIDIYLYYRFRKSGWI